MKLRVAATSDLPDRTTLKFEFERFGGKETGILAHHDGIFVAYVNRCQHRPLPLDYDDAQFYDGDRELFVCRTHGAAYEPATGVCVMGPCAGDALESLDVDVEGDDVFVHIDEGEG